MAQIYRIFLASWISQNIYMLDNKFSFGTYFKGLMIKYTNTFCSASSTIRKEMFYLTMHSTHFIYGYMASDIW